MDRKDLEERTGLSARTIRFLVQEGIVPSPNGSGRGASYDDTHVDAALRYLQLKAEGVTALDAIRERIAGDNAIESNMLEISRGLELHFKKTQTEFHQFMMNPKVLAALQTLKDAMEGND